MTSPSEPMVDWLRYPETEIYLTEKLGELVAVAPIAREMQADLMLVTSSRLVDWLDHLIMADGDVPRGELQEFGFVIDDLPAAPGDTTYTHPGALFPMVVLRQGLKAQSGSVIGAAVQVESIGEFLMTHQLAATAEGSILAPYRRARLWWQDGKEFSIVERRGHRGFVPLEMPPGYAQHYLNAFERWQTRPRQFGDPRDGMDQTLKLARSIRSDLGTDVAAWVAFAAEREYWQRRNKAGQVQKARQDRLGLGWANHDHHTFRSSRAMFPKLIEVLETFGFRPRERFHAGAEAGWGAQVMEQPACRFAVFADVDLSPDEVNGDFAHRPMAPREEMGTVGLWCALHGESLLSAGLHHLAGRFDFEAATAGLASWGIEMMSPFSRFSYLRQAFTRGERWQVSPDRLERLIVAGLIDQTQAARFAEEGTVGSHLENIQRGDGFKGFNQQMVSDIIRRTDPRADLGAA